MKSTTTSVQNSHKFNVISFKICLYFSLTFSRFEIKFNNILVPNYVKQKKKTKNN